MNAYLNGSGTVVTKVEGESEMSNQLLITVSFGITERKLLFFRN